MDKEKIEKVIEQIAKLRARADERANWAAMGYDDGFYSGEENAYAVCLELLREAIRD